VLYFSKWSRTQLTRFGRWFRDQVLGAYVFPFLGLVTRQELEQALATIRAAGSTVTSSRSERIVQRLGVKVKVTERAWDYLNNADDAMLDIDYIHSVLHGPFCPVCMFNLVGLHHTRAVTLGKCPNCDWTWAQNDGHEMGLYEIKRAIYKDLSAEVRRTGSLQDTDEPAQPQAT